MPLSEHEQKMLDEMERQLFAEDPRLAKAFAPKKAPARSGRRIVIGLGGVVVGMVLLVVAVAWPAIWLGAVAFLVMLAGAVYAITTPAVAPDEGGEDADASGGGPPQRGGDFMRKMEERWEKRSGEDPGR